MRVSTRKAHPQGKGRSIERSYKMTGSSSSCTGGGTLPEDVSCVSIMAHSDDGEDTSTSSRVFVAFTADDDGDVIDSLIGKLTDLRAKMRRDRGAAGVGPCTAHERALIGEHKIIEAIKAVRMRTGLGLRDSKRMVDAERGL